MDIELINVLTQVGLLVVGAGALLIMCLNYRKKTIKKGESVPGNAGGTEDAEGAHVKAESERLPVIIETNVGIYHKFVRCICVFAIILFASTALGAHRRLNREKMCNFMVKKDTEITQRHEERVQKSIRETADKAVQKIIVRRLLSSTTNDVAINEVQVYVKNNKYLFNKNSKTNAPPFYLVSSAYLDKDGNPHKDDNPRFLTQDERKKILICIGKAGGIDAPLTTIMREVLGDEKLINNLKLDYASEGITLEYYDKLAIIIGYINGQKDKESKK